MVTIITNKLKNQSLEDLPSEPLKMSTNSAGKRDLLETESPEWGFGYQFCPESRSGFGHTRTRSYPTHNLRGSNCRATLADSFTMHATASTSNPPASKKLCRSLSVPEEESSDSGGHTPWVPKASRVWQPVKGISRILPRPRSVSSPAETLRNTSNTESEAELPTTTTGVNSISTPPASPTPRPASAFAALDEGIMFFKSGEEKDGRRTPRRGAENTGNTADMCPRLHRSRSQPCFERARTCGIKRRIEEDFDFGNNLRPALDLAKMEESSYFRCKDKRRGLRIPKYSNKRDSRGLAAPYFTEQESFILKPIVSSPLDAKVSSIMITPTSSPTKQLDSVERDSADASILNIDKDRMKDVDRIADEGVFHLDYDSEIDITSIEEDDFV